MATAATILLDFGKQLGITVRDNKTWDVSGDPKGVLDVEGGVWKFTPTAGTELISNGLTQIVLVGWSLSATPAGGSEDGMAYLFPETSNILGSFKITLST